LQAGTSVLFLTGASQPGLGPLCPDVKRSDGESDSLVILIKESRCVSIFPIKQLVHSIKYITIVYDIGILLLLFLLGYKSDHTTGIYLQQYIKVSV
jgi:Kef-type K+ transport system membrane component KefB